MPYPKQEDTIELLLDAARKAAVESASEHPEDIAYSMITAIEYTHPTILKSFQKFSS